MDTGGESDSEQASDSDSDSACSRRSPTGAAAAVVPALSSSPFPRLRAARCRGLTRCRQADRKISSRSHGGHLAISFLHRDGEAARSKLKHADDAPPLNTDSNHWHYRRRSREDEAAPFSPSSIRGSPIRRNISIQIPSPGTRFSHQCLVLP
uniref:Uncharacterized protein n=1 Tax=Oryza rufipogon TaxID=4529 RepID=A0A0E0P2F0_ORYRU